MNILTGLSGLITILFIILCFISIHLLIYIKISKARILMLNLVPVLLIITPQYFNQFGIELFQAAGIIYIGLFLIPHTNLILLMEHSFSEKIPYIKTMNFILVPFLILFLFMSDYRFELICSFHLISYLYIFITLRKKIFEKILLISLLINSIFITLYFCNFIPGNNLIIIFTISFLLNYFIIIWNYTKKINSFSSRFSSLNILNKNLNN